MTKRGDPPHDLSALNTAYAYNTRPGARRAQAVPSGWDAQIDRLLAEDYQFLGFRYDGAGCLYRGVSCGLDTALIGRGLGSYDDGRPLARLEAQLGVCLVSHDLPDALSVARLWESGAADAAIYVFAAEVFAEAWEARRAAVLGFAEPGVVFKYPFLVEPPPLDRLALIVVTPALRRRYEGLLGEQFIRPEQQPLRAALEEACASGLWERIVAPEAAAVQAGRTQAESAVAGLLAARKLVSAVPQPTEVYPRRSRG